MYESDLHLKPQKSKFRSLLRFMIAMSLLAVLGFGAVAAWLYSYSVTKGPQLTTETVVIIPQGSSFIKVSQILAENGLIKEDVRFGIIARLLGLSGKIRAGEFLLPTGKTPVEVLRTLTTATPVQHPITIVEGLSAKEIAQIFADKKWCSADDFMALVHDAGFISTLGLGDIKSLEGYLYPDTYNLTRSPDFSAEKIIRIMAERFHQVWRELDATDENRHDTVILASIVEKETGDPSERSRIASVFHNRLRIGMRLQSDPTVIYGIDDFDGNITRKDLKRKNPYNTYVIKGLPAGPICNPGKAALHAVLHPTEERYLYFVSKNDGTHYFSKTLREHNNAVYKYQIRRKK